MVLVRSSLLFFLICSLFSLASCSASIQGAVILLCGSELPGVSNVQVNLFSNSSLLATDFTNSSGVFLFTSVSPGSYSISLKSYSFIKPVKEQLDITINQFDTVVKALFPVSDVLQLKVPPDTEVDVCGCYSPSCIGNAIATTNCPNEYIIVSYTDSKAEGTECYSTFDRVWKAEAEYSLPTEQPQKISLVDTTAPSMVPPADITVSCITSTATTHTGVPTVSDCDPDQTLHVQYFDTILSRTRCSVVTSRNWVVDDLCGNVVSAVQMINQVDNIPPTLRIPPDTTTECSRTSISYTGQAKASDSCSGVADISHHDTINGDSCKSEIYRLWTADDVCGNQSNGTQTITSIDNQPPIFTYIPPDVQLPCNVTSTSPDITGKAQALDNCNAVVISYSDTVISDPNQCQNKIKRYWTATDTCGNLFTVYQLISYGES